MKQLWRRHWFLFLLGFAFASGFGSGDRLLWMLDVPHLRSGIVFAVMFLTCVSLRADAIRRSVTAPAAASIAIALNVVAVPSACWLIGRVLPADLAGGLFVAGLVPCTLASAAVWTRRAGGDDSIALLTTAVTNLACVVVVPVGLMLGLGVGRETTSAVSTIDQVMQLFWTIAVPMISAQAARRWGLAGWADREKQRISIAAQSGILLMVFFGALATTRMIADHADASGYATRLVGVLLVILAAGAAHSGVLWLGLRLGHAAGVGRDRQIAVGFSASQKTLMVGLQIAIDCGVSVIPMLVYHLTQLIIDTYVADRWRREAR